MGQFFSQGTNYRVEGNEIFFDFLALALPLIFLLDCFESASAAFFLKSIELFDGGLQLSFLGF